MFLLTLFQGRKFMERPVTLSRLTVRLLLLSLCPTSAYRVHLYGKSGTRVPIYVDDPLSIVVF